MSNLALEAGRHTIDMRFQSDSKTRGSGGTVTFTIDGQPAGSGHVAMTLPGWISHIEGLDVGSDTGTPVSKDYTSAASIFNGRFDTLRIQLTD